MKTGLSADWLFVRPTPTPCAHWFSGLFLLGGILKMQVLYSGPDQRRSSLCRVGGTLGWVQANEEQHFSPNDIKHFKMCAVNHAIGLEVIMVCCP